MAALSSKSLCSKKNPASAGFFFGESSDEALREVVDGIESTPQSYMQDCRDIPTPGASRRGQRLSRLPLLAVTKLGLYQTMQTRHMHKTDLPRLLGVPLPQIDRQLGLRRRSKLKQAETALNPAGYHLELAVLAA